MPRSLCQSELHSVIPSPSLGDAEITLLSWALKVVVEQVRNRGSENGGIYFACDNVKFGTKDRNAMG